MIPEYKLNVQTSSVASNPSFIIEESFIPVKLLSVPNSQFNSAINGSSLGSKDLSNILKDGLPLDFTIQNLFMLDVATFEIPSGTYQQTITHDNTQNTFVFLYLTKN